MMHFIWHSYKLTQWLTVTLLGLVLWVGHGGLAQAAEPAGFVLMAAGKVQALQTNNSYRKLRRKSLFFAGETLVVGEKAKAQVRFSDGSLVSLRPGTQIRIDEYRFNEGHKGVDKNIFTLLNGGFRTITGKIGKKNPDNYQMKSSVASIGVRGTTYEVVLDKGLNVAAWQGSIVLKNQAGEMTLGSQGQYNYAVVNSPKSAPRGMMRPPAAIGDERELSREEMAEEEGGQEAEQEGEQEAAQQEDDESAADEAETDLADEVDNDVDGEPDTETHVTEVVAKDDEEQDPGGAEGDVAEIVEELAPELESEPDAEAAPETPAEPNPEPEPITDPITEPEPVTETDPVTEPVIDPVIEPEIPTVPEPVVEVDQRVDGITLDRVAMAVSGGISQQGMLIGGQAGYDLSGSLLIADNGFDPSEAEFTTADYLKVMKQGGAVLLDSGTVSIDSDHDVAWGVWLGTANAPILVMTDPADASIADEIAQTVYWAETTAAPAAAFARNGNANYQNVRHVSGGGSGGAISEMYLNLSINFDTLVATGAGSIATPAEVWHLSLNGGLTAPVLDFTSVTGEVDGQAITGEFSSVMTGSTAQAVVSSFDLHVVSDPNSHVEGLVVVDETPIPDLRLSTTELASVDRFGIAMKQNGQVGPQWIFGQATDGAGFSPIIIDKGFALSSPALVNAPAVEVLRQGGASFSTTYVASGYPVHWGTWTSGAEVQLDSFDPLAAAELSESVRWMTVLPASSTSLSGLTGKARLSPIHADGNDAAGNALSLFSMGLALDFDTASFSGSGWAEQASGERWNLHIDGSISAAELVVNNVTADRTDAAGANQAAANAEVSMLLTGTGDALAGAYEMELATDASQYVGGNFLLGVDQRLDTAAINSLDRVGFGLHSNSLAGMHWTGGQASDGALAGPLLTGNAVKLVDPHYKTAPILDVLREGSTAALTAATTHADLPVSWGVWAAGAELQTEAHDLNSTTTLIDPVVWLTALPTSKDVFDTLLGKVRYYASGNDGYSSNTGGWIGWSELSLVMDFDQGTYKGYLYTELGAATDMWAVFFDGQIEGPQLSVENSTASFNGVANAGVAQLGLVITGETEPGIAAVYDLEHASNPTGTFVQGSHVAILDQRLTLAEQQGLDHLGYLIGPFVDSGLSLATAADAGSPLIGNMNSDVLGSPEFESQRIASVYRVGSASETRATAVVVGGDTAFTVNWGSWNGSHEALWDPKTNTASPSTAATAHWLSFKPTPETFIASKTGTLVFDAPVGVLATANSSTAIDPASLAFNATLDFDSAAISGSMSIAEAAGANPWNVSSFNGTLAPSGQITVDSLVGLHNAITIMDNGTSMMLTGPNAEGLVGEFNWGGSGSVQGVFVVCQAGEC